MQLIVVSSVLFLVAVVLLVLGISWGTRRLADQLVGERHRAIQALLETEEVPESWRAPYERRIARLRRRGREASAARLQREAQERHRQKLDELIRYARTSPLVETEETRKMLLDKLIVIRENWTREMQ